MIETMNYSTPVIIVGGCGTFGIYQLTNLELVSHGDNGFLLGLSTAWYLARAGYTDIQCLDRWPVPSKSSAGYDRNKVCSFVTSHLCAFVDIIVDYPHRIW